ncbi:hypothetical protein V8G54_023886 [Vigna mungo]|uniref:Uncharacterized protein n=1 Tax=Vigna mungo TaxID=3915 RepID=A0AAQ3N5H0_VIGMU
MRMQNSIWLRAPSPSKSPSMSMHNRSSSLTSKPSKKVLTFKLSNVMRPMFTSMSKRNPSQSSPMNPSTPSLAIMEGKESSKSKASPSSMVERKYNKSERNEDKEKLRFGSGLEEKNHEQEGIEGVTRWKNYISIKKMRKKQIVKVNSLECVLSYVASCGLRWDTTHPLHWTVETLVSFVEDALLLFYHSRV